MNKIEVGLYSVVRIEEKDEESVVDYGFPFCAIDDRAACGMVREALKKDSIYERINLSDMYIKKIGYFYPSSGDYPITSLQPTIVARCDEVLKGDEEVEREKV